MSIVVTVLEFPQGTSLSKSSMTFDEQGGSIGRTQSNTWVLADPECFLSGSHCKIIFDSGIYFLVDTSTNGTFVNHSEVPLGKGNRVQLNNGDLFELSDYKFQVQLSNASSSPANFPRDNNPVKAIPTSVLDHDDPFAAPIKPLPVAPASFPELPSLSDPFAASKNSSALPFATTNEEMDPLAALNKSNKTFDSVSNISDPFARSYSDNADAANQSVVWPNAVEQKGLIPENWDDDLSPTPMPTPIPAPVPAKPIVNPLEMPQKQHSDIPAKAAIDSISISESEARRRALEKENKKIRAELANLKSKVVELNKRSSSGVDTTFVDAVGFKEHNLNSEKIAEINEISGAFIRHVVAGLMQTLASRNNVKNTFRMNMTTIQPVENNPLKFSANVDDALNNMFIKEGNSYKKPIETVLESFESIADHQVAILAGIRSAFSSIVNRFEPSTLEVRFEKQNKRGLLPRNEKAKYWDSFHEYYNELFSDLDSSFQYLFGDEFSQAYEEQLQILSLARKKDKSNKSGS